MERLASVPMANKNQKNVVHMQLDLETVSVSDEKDEVEKPKKAVLVASSDGTSTWHMNDDEKNKDMELNVDQVVGWVPQIKSKYGTNILAPKPSLKRKETQPKPQQRQQLTIMNHQTMPSLSGSESLGISPPPSYSMANSIGGLLSGVVDMDVGGEKKMDRGMLDTKKIPIPPTPDTRLEAPPPTPPASASKFKLEVPTEVPPPLPSPARSSSFVTTGETSVSPQIQEHVSSASRIGHVKNTSSQSSYSRPPSVTDRAELPRLMTVIDTFTPNLDDELPVKIGDTVRMLEEFQDGWCTVQHLGKYNAARGAVPKLCLQERRSIVPTRKISNGSLSSTMSGSFRR